MQRYSVEPQPYHHTAFILFPNNLVGRFTMSSRKAYGVSLITPLAAHYVLYRRPLLACLLRAATPSCLRYVCFKTVEDTLTRSNLPIVHPPTTTEPVRRVPRNRSQPFSHRPNLGSNLRSNLAAVYGQKVCDLVSFKSPALQQPVKSLPQRTCHHPEPLFWNSKRWVGAWADKESEKVGTKAYQCRFGPVVNLRTAIVQGRLNQFRKVVGWWGSNAQRQPPRVRKSEIERGRWYVCR